MENMTQTHQYTSKHSKHETKYSRRERSPSESSVDSSADVFDPELRQKYMRAVAYLRILDDAPMSDDINETMQCNRQHRADTVDIDFVIQQARQIAQANEHTNPERSRRILEKVHRLEVSHHPKEKINNCFLSNFVTVKWQFCLYSYNHSINKRTRASPNNMIRSFLCLKNLNEQQPDLRTSPALRKIFKPKILHPLDHSSCSFFKATLVCNKRP